MTQNMETKYLNACVFWWFNLSPKNTPTKQKQKKLIHKRLPW